MLEGHQVEMILIELKANFWISLQIICLEDQVVHQDKALQWVNQVQECQGQEWEVQDQEWWDNHLKDHLEICLKEFLLEWILNKDLLREQEIYLVLTILLEGERNEFRKLICERLTN